MEKTMRSIAVNTGLGLRISKRNLKDFMASIFKDTRQLSSPLLISKI